MAINVKNSKRPRKIKLPKTSIFYLLLAGLVDLVVAFMPVWSLTTENSLFGHFVQSFKAVLHETEGQPSELVAIFWLPFGVGVICLSALLAAFFVSHKAASARVVIFIPIGITIGALVYFLVMWADIHILAISLLPLAGAWWEYHKSGIK